MMRWMTHRQMLDRFDSEWVLIGDPRTDESLEVAPCGVVAIHRCRRKVDGRGRPR